MKTDLIPTNPADKVDRPKKTRFVGSFYDSDEINGLFEACEGQKIELAVLLGAFYGLRRSEIVGLKWDAIDFNKKSITIRFTVTEASIDGRFVTGETEFYNPKLWHPAQEQPSAENPLPRSSPQLRKPSARKRGQHEGNSGMARA